jgi:hypothetical protein
MVEHGAYTATGKRPICEGNCDRRALPESLGTVVNLIIISVPGLFISDFGRIWGRPGWVEFRIYSLRL